MLLPNAWGLPEEVEPGMPIRAGEKCLPGRMRPDTKALRLLKDYTRKVNSMQPDDMETADAPEPIRAIESYITQKVADILEVPLAKVDVHRPLNTLGIDSLMAMELKTDIEEDMGIEFPFEVLFLGASIADLRAHVLWQRTSGKGLEAKDGPLGKLLLSGRQSGETVEREGAHGKTPEIQPECLPFEDYPEYRNLQRIMLGMKAARYRQSLLQGARRCQGGKPGAYKLLQI